MDNKVFGVGNGGPSFKPGFSLRRQTYPGRDIVQNKLMKR